MAQVNIRMDDQLKEQAIPFKITAPADPFYSESNMKAMHESIAPFDTPDSPKIIKTIEELRAMD